MKYSKQMQQVRAVSLKEKCAVDAQELIGREERRYARKMSELALRVLDSGCRIILLTGPSASGKTTTARRLIQELEWRKKQVYQISLDDFYQEHDVMPHWDDGKKNYESIDGLDLDLFHRKMRELLSTGTAEFPIFDFNSGCRSQQTKTVKYDEESYLIVEGLHALNPVLMQEMSSLPVLRVYVSVHTDFIREDDSIEIPARNIRLMRRLLRDRTHRDTEAAETLEMWQYVLKGEELYIQPFRKLADIHINTTHFYEPFLYRDEILSMLKPLEQDQTYGAFCRTLMSQIEGFPVIGKELVPADSLIQEFIG